MYRSFPVGRSLLIMICENHPTDIQTVTFNSRRQRFHFLIANLCDFFFGYVDSRHIRAGVTAQRTIFYENSRQDVDTV